MSAAAVPTAGSTALPDVDREIGRVAGHGPGPTLIVVAGIHGNEPAGVHASRRVLARLQQPDVKLRGELVVFAGNLAGLREGVRYHARDLNRSWAESDVDNLRAKPESALVHEDHEQRALLQAIEEVRMRARGRVHIADLHTSSAPGLPFVLFGDNLAQRAFVRAFPIPVILGLVEQVDGVLCEYFTRRGCVAFCVEGGQHHDASSVDSLEATLWLALAQAGHIDAAQWPEVARAHATLERARGDLPRTLEVVRRHAITADDAFEMAPGFRNIDRIARHQRLARDRRGDILAPTSGVVVLPLYQKLGSDGFFWAREVKPRELVAARVVRQLPVQRLASLLPGVSRDEHDDTRVIVQSPSVPVAAALRFLGFRRSRPHARGVTLERAPD